MRDDENNDWATLISAHHIDLATKYIMRLAKALRMAFILQFSIELSKEGTATEELFNTLLNPHLCSEDQLGEWEKRFNKFLKTGRSLSGTFALHVDMLHHLDGIGALYLAERFGGEDGYNLLLASTKSSILFSFLNGATSYASYSIQLLWHHYRAGIFYTKMKSVFSVHHLPEREQTWQQILKEKLTIK